MKKVILLLILASSLYSGNHTILFSLFSKHIESTDMHGDTFNEENYGVGYQYSTSGDTYLTFSAVALKDSYKHNMYTTTLGINKSVLQKNGIGVSLGAEFGVAYKAVKHSNKKEVDLLAESGVTLKKKVTYEYSPVPILLVPKVTISYKQFSVNILYIPEVEIQSNPVDAVLWATFGYTF